MQDDAMGRKVLKVGHHAVSQLPNGNSMAPVTDGNVPDAACSG